MCKGVEASVVKSKALQEASLMEAEALQEAFVGASSVEGVGLCLEMMQSLLSKITSLESVVKSLMEEN